MFDQGFIWYDRNQGEKQQEFFDFKIFNESIDWFKHCKDRQYGPDRPVIALAPQGNSLIERVKLSLDNDISSFGLRTQLYESREEIFNILSSSNYERDGVPGFCFGAILEESDSALNKYQLNMVFDDIDLERAQDSNMPNQERNPYNIYQRKPDLVSWDQYKLSGYTYLQNIFANAILQERIGANSFISMVHTPMMNSKYVDDDFNEAASNMWNILILLIFLAPLYRFVYNSTEEKGTKIREAMKIMGLNDAPYWVSWFSYFIILNTLQ